MASIFIDHNDVRALNDLYWRWVQARAAKSGVGSVSLPAMAGPMADDQCSMPGVPDDFLPVLTAAGIKFTVQQG